MERRLGGYELVAPLATGGMAELFIAKTGGVSGFEKKVALKVIHPNFSTDPEFVRMLVDEAKLAVQLQHANIVQTYDLGHVDDQYYIAMELIDGADLYKVLKTGSERGFDFPIDVAAFITSEVANGLDYAHRKNDPMGRPLMIVHRDVSPQNVLVSFEGEVKIVDFGIAKAALRNQQTQAGVIKGKYYYMSPEQAWGDKIDARTDVFSTGILLHEMLVGEMLYMEEDLEKLLKLVRAAEIEPPSRKRPDVPADLDAIVMKALAKRPEDRYQSAADLGNALTRFVRAHFSDFSRGRIGKFVREVMQQEASRADITPPPPARDEFGDENSLIFDIKNNRKISPQKAHKPPLSSARRGDQETRGVQMPRPAAPRDYEEGGATEFDPKPMSAMMRDVGTDPDTDAAQTRAVIPPPRPRQGGGGFLDVRTDAEPTELAVNRRGAAVVKQAPLGFDPTDEDESTHMRAPSPPPDRARKPSAPPLRRGGNLPPVASPPAIPRAAMGLGVSDSDRRGIAVAPPRPPEPPRVNAPPEPIMVRPETTPTAPNPSPSPFGQQYPSSSPGSAPLDDWAGAPTVTPDRMGNYTRSNDFMSLSSSPSLQNVKRKKLFFIAGVLLGIAVLVLSIALVWPEGPQRGSIEVISVPPGAAVRIDGNVLQKLTPIRISDVELRQAHRIAVSLRGYDAWESDAKFEGGEHDIRIQAILVPSVGKLEIKTTPAGAEAIVNGRISGTTPVTVGDLPPNEDVTLELRARGYKAVYKTMQWQGKRTLSISVPLEKAR